jgi:PIN domain nuclease of toxin-antitoxin system
VILLDTSVIIWFIEGSPQLGAQTRLRINGAATGQLCVCAMSFWEIGLLLSKRRLALTMSTADLAQSLEEDDRFRVVPVDSAIAIEAGTLPQGIHGDPGDRMLIATARLRACPLLTSDSKILAYAAQGHVQAIDARR